MSDVLSAEDVRELAWLPAKLRDEAEYFGAEPVVIEGAKAEEALARYLNEAADALDALARSHEQLRGELDAALDRESGTSDTLDADRQEIARLREFGEHYSGAAQDAWDRIAVLEKALREIVQEEFQAFDHREGYMQHLARCGYVGRAALAAAAPVSTETAE